MHGTVFKLRFFCMRFLLSKIANVPIIFRDSIAALDKCSSKVARFTKCLLSTAEQLPVLQRNSIFADPIWPTPAQHFCTLFCNARNIHQGAFVYTSAAVSGCSRLDMKNPAVAAAGQ